MKKRFRLKLGANVTDEKALFTATMILDKLPVSHPLRRFCVLGYGALRRLSLLGGFE